MNDIYYPETDQVSLITMKASYDITLVPKKYHLSPLYVFEDKRCYKSSPYSIKIKYILSTILHTFTTNLFLEYSSPMWIKK